VDLTTLTGSGEKLPCFASRFFLNLSLFLENLHFPADKKLFIVSHPHRMDEK